jgi:hypothetical protein
MRRFVIIAMALLATINGSDGGPIAGATGSGDGRGMHAVPHRNGADAGAVSPDELAELLGSIKVGFSFTDFGEYNPVALIRAVNRLRTTDKATLIAGFQHYLATLHSRSKQKGDTIVPTEDPFAAIPMVVGLLFVPGEPGCPPPWHPTRPRTAQAPDVPEWDGDCLRPMSLTVFQDIPFLTRPPPAIGTGPPSVSRLAERYLAWADAWGKLRDGPLVPPDDPLRAADEFLNEDTSLGYGLHQDRFSDLRTIVRRQAWAMVEPIAGPRPRPGDAVDCSRYLVDDATWEELKLIVEGAHIRWDKTEQSYVGRDAQRRE